MAITINSKFVKFNYVKYRTVEGQEGPQPYVREDIAEILDAIVNYGSIAFIYGYDNTLPWPDDNVTKYIPDDPQILGGNVIFAQGKWFGTSKASLEDALGDSNIIEKLETVLNIGHPAKPAVGESGQPGYVPAVEATGIFAEIDNLRFFNQIAVPVDGTSQYVMGATKPGATLTIKGKGSTKVTADAGTITISSNETTKNNIIIAGGPLANNVTEDGDTWPTDWKDDAGNKIIPKNKSLEEILKVLFLQEKYGILTDPVYAWDPALSNKPSVDIKKDDTSVIDALVPVGTEVSVSFSPSAEAINQATATVSGATYGYSLNGTTIENSISYTANATGQRVDGTLAIESATFQGVDVESQQAGKKYKVKEGDNILNVTQGGLTATPGTFADATIYNVSNTKTINTQGFKTINQAGFEAATSVYAGGSKALSNSISVKVTGYYPIYYGWLTDTSDTIKTEYVTAHFVDILKSKLKMTDNANVPKTTELPVGCATFMLAVKDTSKSIITVNDAKDMPAGSAQYVDIAVPNDADNGAPIYRVFFITNKGVSTQKNTFTITLS